MRRSRRADADTPRDTPGNVEATRAAANAASSEEDSSIPSALGKEPVRVTTGLTHDLHMIYCYQPRSTSHPYASGPREHAPEEDKRRKGRVRMDDDVGSVSTVCSDTESDFLDVALEACWQWRQRQPQLRQRGRGWRPGGGCAGEKRQRGVQGQQVKWQWRRGGQQRRRQQQQQQQQQWE